MKYLADSSLVSCRHFCKCSGLARAVTCRERKEDDPDVSHLFPLRVLLQINVFVSFCYKKKGRKLNEEIGDTNVRVLNS